VAGERRRRGTTLGLVVTGERRRGQGPGGPLFSSTSRKRITRPRELLPLFSSS